jgi:O-acetyl-ADP-ribose deacetylase (regulator of RNase III)
MIHEVTGDILLSTSKAIAHGVAPHDHFDQGLALALRQEWPAMAKDFRHWCKVKSPRPGELWVWPTPTGVRFIALLTQEPAAREGDHPGRAKPEHVRHSLQALCKLVAAEDITSLALPRLATGVGGLDWSAVRPLIDDQLGALKIPVSLYTTYRAGMKASEPAR